ncbi:hypothetical protein BDV24DRAFT_159284 [Aspergillus arachidicola]|uniref:Uncharacterized protein n=1 Tax=Aspergillus arachidicola TaxID=656916 RepID=A0A5N6YLN8_9EURO|nr:hypothetical protein BDV24DRAFT_159284 [Aspergillus arachidicola]
MQPGHGTTCPTSTRSSSDESDSDAAMLKYKWKRLFKQASIFKEYEKALLAKLKRRYEDNKEAFETQHSEKEDLQRACIKT